jgi:hypothetical protein
MRAKLKYSLESLQNWIQRAQENSKDNAIDLEDFVSVNNLDDFINFYRELIPFVNQVKIELPHCSKLCDEFCSNINLIETSMKTKSSWFSFIYDEFSSLRKQSINPLLKNLEVAFANVGNIIYQLKINEE